MVILALRFRPSHQSRRELMEILRHVRGPTLDEPGCLECEIYDGAGEDETVLLLEQWDSEAALKKHFRAPLYRHVLEAMELSSEPPVMQCHTVLKTQGMELVAQSRTSAAGMPENQQAMESK
jgi:quinol monooxygenase YgiN